MKLRIHNDHIFNRRKERPPIPSNRLSYLNAAQIQTYFDLKKIGWKMYFIRRPRSRKYTIAMINNVGTRTGVINPDGSFDFLSSTIKMRLQKKA